MSPSPFSSLIPCPTCGHPYEVTDPKLLGQLVRCPKCSGLIMLGPPQEENLPEDLPRAGVDEDTAAPALPEQLGEANPAALPEGLHTPPPVIGGGNTDIGVADGDGVIDEVIDEVIDGDSDDADDDDLEGISILLSTPFLFGLGVLAALILAIVVFLLIRVFKTAPPEVPGQPPQAANRFEPIFPEPAIAENTAETAAENLAGAAAEEVANENFDSQGSGLSRENYGKDTPEPDDTEPDDTETGESEAADAPETDTEGSDAPEADRPSDDTPGDAASPPETAEDNPSEPSGGQTDQSDPADQPSSDPSEPIRIDPALAGGISESIDIPGQLALGIRSIQLPNKTLPELVWLIGSLANVPILVAWETIPSPPAFCSRTVTVSLDETTVGTVLEEAARLLGLSVEILPDAVRLYLPDEAPGSKEFNIADLLAAREPSAGEPSAAEEPPAAEEEGIDPSGEPAYLILPEVLTPEAIERFLASLMPISPQDSPTLAVDHETVKVQGPARFLARTARVLDQLRRLRKIDSPDLLPPEELIPETLAFEQLSGDISLNFLTSVTLSEALLFFTENTSTEQTRMKGMVDTATLRQAGISLQTRMPLHCDRQPAEQVLTELANGFGLTWFTPAADVVVVTTKQRVQELPSIEIHSSKDRADGFLEKAAQLARDAGGVLWYDSVSGCVIVHADAVTQRRIEHL